MANQKLTAQLFVGDKIDYLVKKFISILKVKVKERKDVLIQQQNEKLIQTIVKKQAFNENFQKVTVSNKTSRIEALNLADQNIVKNDGLKFEN